MGTSRHFGCFPWGLAPNDWPRYKAVSTGEEQELVIWLDLQQSKLRRGELDAFKSRALDGAMPGWQMGRQRGRQPRTQP